MGVVLRWAVTVAGSLACFGGCWGGLAAERVLDTGSQVGIASIPLVVVLTVLGELPGLQYWPRPRLLR
jgi:hypothetical protein